MYSKHHGGGEPSTGKQSVSWGRGSILHKVAKEGLTEDHTCEQILEEGGKEHGDIWAEGIPGGGHGQGKALSWERACQKEELRRNKARNARGNAVEEGQVVQGLAYVFQLLLRVRWEPSKGIKTKE